MATVSSFGAGSAATGGSPQRATKREVSSSLAEFSRSKSGVVSAGGRVHGSGTASGGMPAGGDALRAGVWVCNGLFRELEDLHCNAHRLRVVQ